MAKETPRRSMAWTSSPDHFASILFALGDYYNEAHIIVENNSHGILTCTRLIKDLAYQQRVSRDPG